MTRRVVVLLAPFLLMTAVAVRAELPCQQIAKLTPSDGAAGDRFGSSDGISGDTVIVSAIRAHVGGVSMGSVYVFQRDHGGANSWGQVKKIVPPDGAEDDVFGAWVMIEGDTVAISAIRDDDKGTNSGSVYIFYRNQGGADSWGLVKKITPSDGEAHDWFGRTLALSGDTLVVGAAQDPHDNLCSKPGAAYIFYRNQGGTDSWGQVAKISASDGAICDFFGYPVRIDGDTIVAGADVQGTLEGAVYVFQRHHGGTDAWGQVTKITASDGGPNLRFNQLNLDGDTLAVGAPGANNSGAVYIFERHHGGTDSWGEVVKITASDGEASDWFGTPPFIAGDTMLVGACGDDDRATDAGAAYVFRRNHGDTDSWAEVEKLTASDGTAGDSFGGGYTSYGIAINRGIAIIGAHLDDENGTDAGSAYLFRIDYTLRLSIAELIPVMAGSSVEVPVVLTTEGVGLAGTSFSIDYDETCLAFDPSDTDADGIPDDIVMQVPAGYNVDVFFDSGDTDGEIDVNLYDASPTELLADGTIATITFSATCTPTAGQTVVAPVGFSSAPPVSFSDEMGNDVPGISEDGSVEIASKHGDCNDNGVLGIADAVAGELEIADGDGSFWLDVPGGTFAGDPEGCDANADTLVDPADVACTILGLFGQGCSKRGPSPQQAAEADTVAGEYIVTFRGDRGPDAVVAYGSITRRWTVINAALLSGLSRTQADALAAEPAVAMVEPNRRVWVAGNPLPDWGLDRLDQRTLPLDHSFTAGGDGTGVHVYVIDTGIRPGHNDFDNRASADHDTVGDGQAGIDCNGHGTHVAGTIAGTTWGVAKNARLHAVRVLGCDGYGTWADVIDGIDWVTANHESPAVATLSLTGPASPTADAALRASMAAGVLYAVAAGNDDGDACLRSPARVGEALSAAATHPDDPRWPSSSFGSCVDLFAPGVDITSAWHTGDTATNRLSGTSMAAAHAAGVAVLLSAAHPEWTARQVQQALVDQATCDLVGDPGAGTPNRLLHVFETTDPACAPPSAPLIEVPAGIAVASGEIVEIPVNFIGNGNAVAGIAFTLEYAASCLYLDPTDGDGDGIPDAIAVEVPASFNTTVLVDGASIHVAVVGTFAATPLADGPLLRLSMSTICTPAGGAVIAPVVFSPVVSFSDAAAQDLDGSAAGGSALVLSGLRGDCNGGGSVANGDLIAGELELFDGDGSDWVDVPGGSYAGNPVGCDANADVVVDAGDVSCIGLLIFGAGCASGPVSVVGGLGLDLTPARTGGGVGTLAVRFRSGGQAVSSIAFSLDIDTTRLSFDASDADLDGIPDAMRFPGWQPAGVSVSYDPADPDGELDVLLAQLDTEMAQEYTVEIDVALPATVWTAQPAVFSLAPRASFGDALGRSLPGGTSEVELIFGDGFESGTTTAWPVTAGGG